MFYIVFVMMITGTCAIAVAESVHHSELLRNGYATFATADGDTLFELPHKWIIMDSLHVLKNGFVLEPYRDYRVVDPGHALWLYSPLAGGDTLVVQYTYSPFPIFRSYAKRSLRNLIRYEANSDSAAASGLRRTAEPETAWSALRRSGSLVRSVQIGTNQDLAFESALSLQVEGKVGSQVEVVAALSDQDLPLQPEGTTESIRELDKVFVTARTPHFNATIGDYELEIAGRRYDHYARKLSGLKLGATSDRAEATLSAAVSRGEFHSNSFFGLESVQGPYPLSGKNGETGIVVLAGTETVWVDGMVARRGESNDYVIDYAAGQISFTSRKLITSDSRIMVEFEYANEDYERQYLAARTAIKSPFLQAGSYLTYISERDDRARPLGLSFNEGDTEQLRSAGDSSTLASSLTADSLGPNGGDYVRRDTLTNAGLYSIFSYVSPSSDGIPQGEWQVFFDDFGSGNGDYEASADSLGRTFFRWIGVGSGRYLPARRLPLPTAVDLVALRLERSSVTGFRANVEAALSTLDLNTYSDLDDADNDGAAGSAEVGFSKSALKFGSYALHNVDASASTRVRGKTFRDVSRSDELEFDREWAVSNLRQANELIGESSLGFSPVKAVNVRGSAGVLTREEALDSRRYSVNGAYQPSRKTTLRGTHTLISSQDSTNASDTEWIRQQLDANTAWSRFTPRLRVNRERQLRNSRTAIGGFRFVDWSGGTQVAITESFALDGEIGGRSDDTRDSSKTFARTSNANTYTSELKWQPIDLGRGAFRWVHRDKIFVNGDSLNTKSDAGRLELLLAPRSRLFEINLLYDALKSRTEEQVQVFEPVGSGLGSYRLENGVYIPDDQGDYILVTRSNTGNFEASSSIHTNAVLWLKPDELRNTGGELWRRFAFETEASLDEETRLPLTLDLLFLNPSKLRTTSTIDGRFSLRQDIHFDRLSHAASFRLRLVNAASQVSRYSNGGQESVRREGSLRMRLRFVPEVRGETEASVKLDRSLYEGVSVASTDVLTQKGSQDVLWSIGEKWETGIAIVASEASDERSRTQASIREVAPRVGYSRFNKGRVDAEFRWVHATSNRGVITQDVGSGANRGENFRWSLRGTLALSDNFSGSLNYTGRQDAGEDTVHIGRVEVRATF